MHWWSSCLSMSPLLSDCQTLGLGLRLGVSRGPQSFIETAEEQNIKNVNITNEQVGDWLIYLTMSSPLLEAW